MSFNTNTSPAFVDASAHAEAPAFVGGTSVPTAGEDEGLSGLKSFPHGPAQVARRFVLDLRLDLRHAGPRSVVVRGAPDAPLRIWSGLDRLDTGDGPDLTAGRVDAEHVPVGLGAEALVERTVVRSVHRSVHHQHIGGERFGKDRDGVGITGCADGEPSGAEAGFVGAPKTEIVDGEQHSGSELRVGFHGHVRGSAWSGSCCA